MKVIWTKKYQLWGTILKFERQSSVKLFVYYSAFERQERIFLSVFYPKPRFIDSQDFFYKHIGTTFRQALQKNSKP